MDPSILIARIAGPLFMLVAIGVFLSRAHYREMMGAFLQNPALVYLSGVLAFVIGIGIVMVHNLWVLDWRLAVTLIGWLSLIKGIGRIVFPRAAPAIGAKLLAKPAALDVSTALLLVVGFYLTVMSATI